MNKKPDDLTPEEWEVERLIGDWILIIAGVAVFLVLAVLAAEKLT